MSENERKEHILTEAFLLFASQGIATTKIDEVAAKAQVSKKTIYALFKSKFELVEESFKWKLGGIANKAQQIVDSDESIIRKLILYLEIIATDATDISSQLTHEVLADKEAFMNILQDYLKGAVYSRFAKLMDQGKEEGLISDAIDPAASLIIYWETLSTYLFSRPNRHIPEEFKLKKPIYQLLGDQMINFFRGLLNEEGIKEFDAQLKNHSKLSMLFA